MEGVVVRQGGKNVLSLYGGAIPTEWEVNQAVTTLMKAFPDQSEEFYVGLTTAVMKSGMRREQLADAVQNLLQNHRFPRFTFAELLSFDKSIPLYTHREVVELWQQGWKQTEFVRETVDGTTFWAKRGDVIKHAARTSSAKANTTSQAFRDADEAARKEALARAEAAEAETERKRQEAARSGVSAEATFAQIAELAKRMQG
jgi:hypothetical protein